LFFQIISLALFHSNNNILFKGGRDERFNGDKIVRSQLHLVDLAGSERVNTIIFLKKRIILFAYAVNVLQVKKSQVAGLRLREAVGINSSLLVRPLRQTLIASH